MSKLKASLTFGILLPQLFILSCSKDHYTSSSSQQEGEPFYLDSSSESQAVLRAQRGRVYCNSLEPSECSPSVGMMVAVQLPETVTQCTAFLVAPQIVMTNSHCVPPDLKGSGSACSNRMWFYFPELSGYPQIRSGCAQVLTASTLPEKAKAVPDYAVIRLDQPVNRPALEVSREGFKDDKPYQLVKISPQSTSEAIGEMTRVTCKAVHNSIVVPNSNTDESANMGMGDCEVVHGNSGSPLLGTDGKVNGVIQLTFESNTIEAALLNMTLPMIDSSIGPLGAGTSFACLDLPADVHASPVSPRCASLGTDPDSKTAQTKALKEKLEKNLETELAGISDQLNPAFQWSLGEYQQSDLLLSSYTQYMIPVPICVKDPSALLEDYHHWYGGYASKAEMSLFLPKMTVKLGLNRYLVLDYHLEHPSGQYVSPKLSYNPDELSKKNSTTFTLDEQEYLRMKTIYSQSLGLCAK